MSLRKYLLISILLIISSVGGLTIWGSYQDTIHEVEELFDAQLAHSSRMTLSLALTEVKRGDISELQRMIFLNKLHFDENNDENTSEHEGKEELEEGHYYESKLAFQVWDTHGNMLLRSDNAPLEPLSNINKGFSNQVINSIQWRVFSLWSRKHKYLVMTAERHDLRMDLIHKITLKLLLPFLLLLPVLALLLWFAVGKGLLPLKRIADEVQSRDERFLDNIDTSNVPKEVLPLVEALNKLFSKIQQSFEKERRFTSDAAHELRTPLAALKTHAQLAKSSNNDKDLQHALTQLDTGVNRANHTVDQLLALARSESGAANQQTFKTIDLHAISTQVAADIACFALDKNIELSVQDKGAINIQGSSTGLSMLIRNLLDNAIRYTPENGAVRIEFSHTKDANIIHVIDTGSGISGDAEKEKVFERFYRGEDMIQSGCGIGLSIVKQIADQHNARIKLNDAAEKGLDISVSFPVSS